MSAESDLAKLLRASIEIGRLKNVIRAQATENQLLRQKLDSRVEFDLSADVPALLRPQA